MLIVKCDKCKKEFEVRQEIEKVKGDIRRVYFICPSCGEKYIAYYLSNKIEHKQEKIKKLVLKLNKYFKGTEKGEKYLVEYEDLRKEIKLDMQELKERFKEE
ncbi:hypothetical protein ACSXCW_02705 [Clostridium perfringens]